MNRAAATADLAFWLNEVRRGDASVPCNGCRHCCTEQLVLLMPNDDPSTYATETFETPVGAAVVLARRETGECVYLDQDGCSIYDRRPAVCRAFDCGKWFERHTRRERRVAVREGGEYQRRLFAEGKRVQRERAKL